MIDENVIKHWGIFGQKWGVRRFQNKDGSLTPEGRERYGVGPARDPHGIGSAMSDDELRSMTKRYRQQADFYNARNDYIQAQQTYAQLMKKPPSFISKFANRFFLKPLGNVMEQNVEFGMKALGASFVEGTDSKYAEEYVNYIFRKSNNQNNNQNNNQQNNNQQNNYHNNGGKKH